MDLLTNWHTRIVTAAAAYTYRATCTSGWPPTKSPTGAA
jgi:hypothetical protein